VVKSGLGDTTMAPVKAVVIGAGDRGLMYSGYALDFPEKFKACICYQL